MKKSKFLSPVVVAAWVALVCSCEKQGASPPTPAGAAAAPVPKAASSTPASADTNAVPAMEVAQSVVVTQDLDFGPKPPTLAEALQQIDRRHQPAEGGGRTFAILEAFNGAIQPDGKLRVSLRISTEKPGVGEIVFKRNGQSLWKNRITPASHKPSFTGGALTILFETAEGKSFTVDGSTGPSSILEAMLKEPGVPVAQAWPEGEVRDLAFIYSACGCPIHVKCKRAGDRTVRTESATQVIFPDDPAAMQIISRLMGW
jgi:hypothetical protein